MTASTHETDEREQRGAGVWVYGVVPANAALRELERRGDSLPEVWVVEAGELGGIAGPAPSDDERGTRDQALAHARVLEAAIVDAPVLPFRFGTIVPDAQEVGEQLLLAHHDELAQLLRRVEGRVQLTLKATYEDEPLLREIVDSNPEIRELHRQLRDLPEDEGRALRVRLGELVSAAVEQAREHDGAELLAQLRDVTVAGSLDPPEREYMVLNAPLLVERDRVGEVEERLELLAEERAGQMRFRLLGPMPAYSFIDIEDPRWD
jgi:Gas vesicle synthesis protein GvpL/GvpF